MTVENEHRSVTATRERDERDHTGSEALRRRPQSVDRRTVLKRTAAVGVAGVLWGTGTVSATDDAGSVRWTFEADGFVESSPTIIDGVVYVGDESGYVYAVDVTDGDELWSFQTGDQIRSDAQVVGGVVYIGSTDGAIYALEADSGRQLWRFQTGSYVNSSPTRVGNTVYVGSEDGNVYALDATTGEEQWRYTTGDIVTNAPTVVDGVVYIGGRDGNVYALNTADGSLEWQYGTDLWVNSAVTAVDGVAYVGSDDSTLYALDAADGSLVWQFTEPAAHVISATTYHDGVVYVATDDETYGVVDAPTDAVLYAVEADTGKKRWEFAVDAEDGEDRQFHASPTVVDGVVYVPNTNGTVYGVDVEDGEVVWTFETGDAVWSSPTVVDGTLYVGSDDEHLYALDIETDASSEDSRVALGTLGHHDEWGEEPSPEETRPPAVRVVTTGFEPVTRGETIQVELTVRLSESTSQATYDVPVGLEVFDTVWIDETIEMSPGGKETLTVDVGTTGVEPGTHEWVTTARDLEESGTVTVEADPNDEEGDDGTDEGDEGTSVDDPDGGDDSIGDVPGEDDIPGPGVVGSLASVGGITYLLKRRLDRADDGER